MIEFESYHGKDGNHHQSRFSALATTGWRIASLSVHGDPADPRYSVVWVKTAGAPFVAVHGLPIGAYPGWLGAQVTQGFAPVLVGVTGTPANAIVAAVCEQGLGRRWIARHGLVNGSDQDQSTIDFWCRQARRDGYVLRSASVYGTSSQRLYAAVWHEEAQAHWNWRVAESNLGYRAWLDVFRQVPMRPAFATLSEQQIYFASFRDDSIGEWIVRRKLTSDGLQAEVDALKPQGFYPICLQGGGTGGSARYTAIFAQRHEPVPRVWNVRGTGLSTFDSAVKDFMVANGVRAGQLSIAKNGIFKAERAYTWADPSYRLTEASHLFRIASLSKIFTCACIQELYDGGLLAESDKAFARLGITSKLLSSQTVDARVDDVTVEHLVDHEGGWTSAIAGDPVFRMREIAGALGLAEPASRLDLVRYMYGEPLQFAPGSQSQYSNLGYLVLASLVEKVTGQTYPRYLRSALLLPTGISDVRLARTKRSRRLPSEVFYDDPNAGPSALDPTTNRPVACCYGGEGWTTEAMDGSGGLCATASAVVRFIGANAVWGRGGRTAGAARTGSMAGVTSRAESRVDGVDFAFVFNTRHLLKMPVDDLVTRLGALISATPL